MKDAMVWSMVGGASAMATIANLVDGEYGEAWATFAIVLLAAATSYAMYLEE